MKRLLLFILLAGSLLADNSSSPSPPPAPIIDFGPLLGAIGALPGQIVSNFFTYTNSGLGAAEQTISDNAFKFMFSNPDPNWFCVPYGAVMGVLEGLFVLALMALALFSILRSGDVEGRLETRKWMENMVIMIIVLSFSFQLFSMLLDFNSYLSSSIASQSMTSIFKFQTAGDASILTFVMLLSGVVLGFLTYLTLLLRYLLIPFMMLLFPVAIFLYFMPPTKKWGSTFLKLVLVFVFMTTADAMVLLGLSALFGSNDPNLVDTFVRSVGLMVAMVSFGFVNATLILLAILGVVSQGISLTGLAGMMLLKGVI